MTASVAIVSWNAGHRLRVCVESILTNSLNSDIVIVDNASTDESLESLKDFRNRIDIVRNSSNRGFAAGVNQAVAQTKTPFVLILNPDVIALPGSVEQLDRFLETHPKAGAVGGFVNKKYLPRNLPTAMTLVKENLGWSPSTIGPDLDDTVEVEQPAAAALMIRRDAYDEIGGFDERFFPAWYEDVDFCRRLRKSGWKIYFAPRARFEHEGGYSAEALGPAAFANAYYHNQLRYVQKHFSFGARFLVRVSIAVGMVLRTIGRPGNVGAHFSVLRGALGGWR